MKKLIQGPRIKINSSSKVNPFKATGLRADYYYRWENMTK